MKTRFLIIIGIVLVVGTTITLGANIMSENAKQREMELNQSHLAGDATPEPEQFKTHPGLGMLNQDEADACADEQDYDEVLFKCVISCKDGLVYNGYTDSCTTEFELKYHGFCNDGYAYHPSTHICLSGGNDFPTDLLHEPLKNPPRTAPPEPGSEDVSSIPSAQEFLQMECKDLNHFYPEFPSKEVADAWITRMHECLNEQENENIFYNKPLSYWKNLDENSLINYYENFGKLDEHFFEDLGSLLIKSHSETRLHELEITSASKIEIDWSGIRPSLPPRMGFDAKVNSTDGKNYLISGTIHGNEILDNFRIVEDSGRRIGWTPAFEYSRVQINGTTALQICSIMEIDCITNPAWDVIHRHDKDFTYFYYDIYGVEPNVQIGEHYIQIDKDQICHSFEDLLSQQISELDCEEIRR